jgi:hypothetical protein
MRILILTFLLFMTANEGARAQGVDSSTLPLQAPPLTSVAVSSNSIFPDLHPYNVQMHLHGHSNHNATGIPASMQWHTAWAAASGTDVLWWTDHTESFDLSTGARKVSLPNGKLNPETLEVSGLVEGKVSPSMLQAVRTGGTAQAALDTNGLHMTLQSDTTATATQWFFYDVKSQVGTVKSLAWTRPVSSGAQLDVELDLNGLDSGTLFEVRCSLAFHKYEREVQQQITYQFVKALPPGPMMIRLDDDTVLVRVQILPGQSVYTLDLSAPAELMRDGADNTLSQIRFRLGAQKGAKGVAVLKSFRINSTAPDPDHQQGEMLTFADQYAADYGVAGYIGVENRSNHVIGIPHLNAYFPAPLTDFTLLNRVNTDEEVEGWVTRIHDLGGLVSINHIYGTSSGFGPFLPAAEALVVTNGLAGKMLDVQGYGADILEVGYPARGGATITDHLGLWDKLTANGLFLVGNGVSDSHGDVWGTQMLPGPFSTWVLAASNNKDALLAGLRQGRVYFGNPFLWKGVFAFQLGDAVMGDHTVNSLQSRQLVVDFNPWPDDVGVYLVQGVLQPGMEVEYLHERTPVLRGETVTVDTSRPTFVRLEAWKTTENGRFALGEPIVFTNPIVMLGAPDGDGDGYLPPEDCNDQDAAVNPGTLEISFNGKDDDCSPYTEDDEWDKDQDGYDSAYDCNDMDPLVSPGIPETNCVDGIDNDCDGVVDGDDEDCGGPPLVLE